MRHYGPVRDVIRLESMCYRKTCVLTSLAVEKEADCAHETRCQEEKQANEIEPLCSDDRVNTGEIV
jgi:hypothetical protein